MKLNQKLEKFLLAKSFQASGSNQIAERILQDAGFFEDLNTLSALEGFLSTSIKIEREQQDFIRSAKNGRR